MSICVNSFVNTDERNLIAGWAIKQMHIVGLMGIGGRCRKKAVAFCLLLGDFPEFLVPSLSPLRRGPELEAVRLALSEVLSYGATAEQAVWLF